MNNFNVASSSDQSPDFYRNFASLFSVYFSFVSDDHIKALDESGYGLYRCVMHIDRIMDDKEVNRLPFMLSLFENTVLTLRDLFQPSSDFWRLWNERKYFLFQSIDNEKKLNYSYTQWSDYCDIAIKKAEMGAVAIDAMHCISNEQDWEIHNAIFQSYSKFSIAFQLLDDVLDLNEDFAKNQFNWLFMCYFQKNGHHILNPSQMPVELKIEILQLAECYFAEAKQLLPDKRSCASGFETAIDYMSQSVKKVVVLHGRGI